MRYEVSRSQVVMNLMQYWHGDTQTWYESVHVCADRKGEVRKQPQQHHHPHEGVEHNNILVQLEHKSIVVLVAYRHVDMQKWINE